MIDSFGPNVRFKVVSCEDVLFWYGVWVGDKPLMDRFSELFRCARDGKAKVSDYMERSSYEVTHIQKKLVSVGRKELFFPFRAARG